MKIPSEVRFVSERVKKSFYDLKKGDSSEKELFNFIVQALGNLEGNAHCGIQIPKKQIPKEYIRRYGIKNLWKYDLPRGWRLIYSVLEEEILVISLVLEWFNHDAYERRFKY
jgi:hypothetical protein